MKAVKISLAVAAFLSAAVSSRAQSDTDIFMRAVGFALTGSDNAEPKAIDRVHYVFKVNDDIYRLDNVHTDRIKIQGWQQQTAWGIQKWVTVSLHGDEPVYETKARGLTTTALKLRKS